MDSPGFSPIIRNENDSFSSFEEEEEMDIEDSFEGRPEKDEIWHRLEHIARQNIIEGVPQILLHIREDAFKRLIAVVETIDFEGLAAIIGLNQKSKLEIYGIMKRQHIYPITIRAMLYNVLTKIDLDNIVIKVDSKTPGFMICNNRRVKRIQLIFGYKDNVQFHTINLF